MERRGRSSAAVKRCIAREATLTLVGGALRPTGERAARATDGLLKLDRRISWTPAPRLRAFWLLHQQCCGMRP